VFGLFKIKKRKEITLISFLLYKKYYTSLKWQVVFCAHAQVSSIKAKVRSA
jgi:hypothetical protein